MAGFPHHALDTYLPKLVRAGKRVAVCDQLEDPKKKRLEIKGKKGLSQMDKMVKRGITELVTPGVAMGDNVLNYKENNFLAAVHFGKTACGVSFLDISTGEFLTGEGTYDYVEKLMGNFMPKEVLYDRPYPNEEKETPYEGFAYASILPVDTRFSLENQADIHALFQMTPYYWKTPKAGAERLAALEHLDCRAAFRVHIFQKLL